MKTKKQQLNVRVDIPLHDAVLSVAERANMRRDEVGDTAYRIALGDKSALTMAKWNIIKRVAKEVGLPFSAAGLQVISLAA